MNCLKDLEYLKDKLKKANITYQTKPLDNIESCLKALEIITRYIELEDNKVYTTGWEWNLTPEEYDLLKEIMK